jgi:hypothetical protein
MTPPPIAIANIDRFLALVGQWNLYDMEIRDIRYHADRVGTGVLELTFYLHADNVRPRPSGQPETEFEFVFRFDDAEGLVIDDFAGSVVGEYEFISRRAPDARPFVEVSISSVGPGDIHFLCSAITVVSAREIAIRAA